MNIETKKIEGCKRIIFVEVDWHEIDSKATQIANTFKRAVRLDGFRPGKAPINYIKRLFAKDIKQEILSDVVPKAIDDYVEKEKVKLATKPEVMDIIYAEQCPLPFTVELEVLPAIELKNYMNIEVRIEALKAEDREIEERIYAMQRKDALLLPVSDRPVKENDYVVVTLLFPGELLKDRNSADVDAA